jgi:hypothetical protein
MEGFFLLLMEARTALVGGARVAVDTSTMARPDALTKAACFGQIGARHWSMTDDSVTE